VPVADRPGRDLVSIVVVSYQSAADLPRCVSSLAAAAGPLDTELVVVDNASQDGSAEVACNLGAEVIENQLNVGLSGAINQGVSKARGSWVLLLNPDARLAAGALATLVETGGSDPRIGCLGPQIRNPDGTPYPTGRRFPSPAVGGLHALLGTVWPSNPATRRYHMADLDRRAVSDVDWVSGSCMLVRRQAFDEAGGFDPGYFMYFEELDFCLRLARAGWRVVFEPRAVAVHDIGGSTSSAPYRKVFNHHRSALRFYRRRFAGDPRLILLPLVAVGLAARAVVSLALALVRRASVSRGRTGH
jgi:N-acetylglucosaminyl-diphospho-decaprenol L-rhamnosyltransferase